MQNIIRTDLRGPWRGTGLDGAELPVTCSLPARSFPGLSHLLHLLSLPASVRTRIHVHVSLPVVSVAIIMKQRENQRDNRLR